MKNIIPFILAIYTLSSPYLIPLLGINESFAWPAVTAGLIAVVILHFKDIKSLSIDKLTVEMRDKLNEAQSIISSLKTFAGALAEHSMTDLMAGCFGFQGGIGRYKRFELKDKIIETLRKVGFADSEIKEIEIRSQWQRGVRMIYWNAISHVLEKRTNENQINPNEPERRKVSQELSALMRQDAEDFTEWNVPTSEEMEKFITDRSVIIDKPLQDWLDDYRGNLSTGKIGRLDDLLKGKY